MNFCKEFLVLEMSHVDTYDSFQLRDRFSSQKHITFYLSFLRRVDIQAVCDILLFQQCYEPCGDLVTFAGVCSWLVWGGQTQRSLPSKVSQ